MSWFPREGTLGIIIHYVSAQRTPGNMDPVRRDTQPKGLDLGWGWKSYRSPPWVVSLGRLRAMGDLHMGLGCS